MPRYETYGGWPRSGEIDLMEMRSNRNYWNGDVHVGHEQVGSTLHFGPEWWGSAWWAAHGTLNRVPAWSEGFHNYKLVWTDQYLRFYYDDQLAADIPAGDGFWKRGDFENWTDLPNPWANAPNPLMAPFDQEFYIIMNNAIGGTAFFADGYRNEPYPKPWRNDEPHIMNLFWNARQQWEPTWNMHNSDSHLVVDYVRVWAA